MTNKNTFSWSEWNLEKKRKKITTTLDITLKFFNEGKTINEICKLRNFKLETVQYQIIELITQGFINIKDVIDEKNLNEISNFISQNRTIGLKQIKENLNENISYFEIKCVIASNNLIPNCIKN